jgi:hypothetical protein
MQGCLKTGIRYKFGEKIRDLSTYPPQAHLCDCSGAVRYLVYQATEGLLKLPDGSVNQREWCEWVQLHRLKKYSDVQYADGSRLFICFIKPTNLLAGHVWLVQGGVTVECHGHTKGFDRRAWNTLVLRLRCDAAYELPTEGGAHRV